MKRPSVVVPVSLSFLFLFLLLLSIAPVPDGEGSGPTAAGAGGAEVDRDWISVPPAVARAQGVSEQVAETGPFYLTFPHTANGSAAGIRCRSSIVLVNNSETNASGRIELFRQNGNPFAVGTNQGIDSQFDFTLFPGESYRLETDGSGSLAIGWIQVVSDIAISGSGTFVLSDGSGKFLSEVGVGNSARSGSAMIFVDTTSGKDTSVAICNPSASTSAAVTLELRKLDGSIVSTRSGGLIPPRNQQARYIRELFPGAIQGVNWANFKGVLMVRSPDTSLGVVTLRTRGTGLTSLPAASAVAADNAWTNLTFARIGDGLIGPYRFQTSIILLNPSANAVTTTVETFSESGTPAGLNWGSGPVNSVSATVPAGGAVELNSNGSNNPAVVGWARTSSTAPVAGSGLFTISEQPGGAFVSQTGVPDSPRSSRISIFGQVSSTVDTGFGLTNFYGNEQQITLRLYRTNGSGQFGTLLAQKTLKIPGMGHTARFISEFFSDVPEVKNKAFEGTVQAENPFSWEFTALTLRTRGVYFTSLPVAPFAEAGFAPKFDLLASTLSEGSRPCTCFRVTQGFGEIPLREAVITLNRGQFNLDLFRQPGTHGEFLEFFLDSILYSGKAFVHEVTTDTAGVFSLVTADGIQEFSPALFALKNLPGGGVEIRFNSSYPAAIRLSQGSSSSLCLEPGAFLIPSGNAQTIQVVQAFESWDRDPPNETALYRNAKSAVGITGTNVGQPKIDSIKPHRVKGGEEIEIRGANFSPVVSENRVTLVGKVNYNGVAEVLEAAKDRLRVRLPSDAKGSELCIGYRNDVRVQVAGKTSAPYHLGVTFSPKAALSLGSLAAGSSSTLTLSVLQGSAELGLMEVRLKASAGSWITSGFTPGQVIGTLTSAFRQHEVRVVSSDASKLVMEAVRAGSQDPALFSLEASTGASGQLKAVLRDLTYTYLTGGNELKVEFSRPVFRMPSATGSGFQMEVGTRSLPERTQVLETALELKENLDFRTN